jgi:uncharacterized repeat protein (TIGR02543 family)
VENLFQGYCEDIALFPGSANNIYCAGQTWETPTYYMGFHKSNDGGKNWTSHQITSEAGVGNAVAVASRNKSIIYVGGSRGSVGALYKSTDEGHHWMEVGKNTFNSRYNQVKDIAVDPEVNNRIYVGCYSGLFKSTDGGMTWSKIHGNPVNAILVHPFETNKIYAGGPYGVVFSADSGGKWTDIGGDMEVEDIECLDMNPLNDILYAGTNGGSVFQKKVREEFVLVIQTGEGGTTDPEPGSYIYEGGEEVTVTAIPDPTYVFSGWTGGVKGEGNPITMTMDKDITIKANFKKALFPPVMVSGEKVMNRSLLLVQYINVLQWEAHPENTEIGKYRIYLIEGDAMQQVAEVGTDTFFYWHIGVEKDLEYRYGICSVKGSGQESELAYVTIK